jgi:hypothetical protein
MLLPNNARSILHTTMILFMQRTKERVIDLFSPTSNGIIICRNAFIKMDDTWEALAVKTLIEVLEGVFHSFNFLRDFAHMSPWHQHDNST